MPQRTETRLVPPANPSFFTEHLRQQQEALVEISGEHREPLLQQEKWIDFPPLSFGFSGAVRYCYAYHESTLEIPIDEGGRLVRQDSRVSWNDEPALEGYRVMTATRVVAYLRQHPEAMNALPILRQRVCDLWGEDKAITLQVANDPSDGQEVFFATFPSDKDAQTDARLLLTLDHELLTQYIVVDTED